MNRGILKKTIFPWKILSFILSFHPFFKKLLVSMFKRMDSRFTWINLNINESNTQRDLISLSYIIREEKKIYRFLWSLKSQTSKLVYWKLWIFHFSYISHLFFPHPHQSALLHKLKLIMFDICKSQESISKMNYVYGMTIKMKRQSSLIEARYINLTNFRIYTVIFLIVYFLLFIATTKDLLLLENFQGVYHKWTCDHGK